MLNAMKNVLTKMTPALPPAESSMITGNDPIKAVKRWELEQGRTHKRLEELTSQQATAAAACAEARRTVGERMEKGEDGTNAMAALTQAEEQLRACELALTIAREKDQRAQSELRNMKLQASIEAEVAALSRLKHIVAPQVDDVLAQLERISGELAAALNHACVTGAGGQHQSFLIDAKLELQRFTNRALHVVTGTGAVPDRMMRYARWSECIPEPDSARTRKR
jgi:hypothetical protein